MPTHFFQATHTITSERNAILTHQIVYCKQRGAQFDLALDSRAKFWLGKSPAVLPNGGLVSISVPQAQVQSQISASDITSCIFFELVSDTDTLSDVEVKMKRIIVELGNNAVVEGILINPLETTPYYQVYTPTNYENPAKSYGEWYKSSHFALVEIFLPIVYNPSNMAKMQEYFDWKTDWAIARRHQQLQQQQQQQPLQQQQPRIQQLHMQLRQYLQQQQLQNLPTLWQRLQQVQQQQDRRGKKPQ